MPVSYADIEKKRLGELAMANQKAQEMLAGEAEQARIQNNINEQQISEDDSITQEALSVIDQMHKAEANGENPLEIVKSLPEELQIRVASIMKDEIDNSNQNNQDGLQTPEQSQPGNNEQYPDQVEPISQVNKG